ncbi:helix-turn-helix domain-containing protein [Solirhodobacter olei]|uniref:helix-turn-helix domain-containing protein n=1 Tax=Solirhodobacter olei TaxID=2493082 RepID=UPI000FDB68CA|nr:XRE family transcriptional regulator [Solirhodobacter olei]
MDLSGNQIGERIKHLRKERGWTLKELSGRAQVSTATLSKIENAQVAATFDTLVKVAQGLNVTFDSMLMDVGASRAGGRLVVTGPGDTVHFATSMYDYEVHSGELRRKRMIPLIMRIKARSLEDITNWSSHAGEEFIFIMKGTVRLYTEFYSPVELKVGESAYIDSEMEHAFVSIGEGEAEIISICLSTQTTQAFFAAAGMYETSDPPDRSPPSK